jgi:hypothetical protein
LRSDLWRYFGSERRHLFSKEPLHKPAAVIVA